MNVVKIEILEYGIDENKHPHILHSTIHTKRIINKIINIIIEEKEKLLKKEKNKNEKKQKNS